MKAQEILLPLEQRRRIKWTSSNTFMRLDGVLEVFYETGTRPLKSHCCLADIGADMNVTKKMPEGCRPATVVYFNDHFFHNHLPGFLLGKAGMQAWVREISGPKAGLQATHAMQRNIYCPVKEGDSEFVPWLRSLFVALQAGNYSPNGDVAKQQKLGVDHASMTVGDLVKLGERLFVVGLDGFYVVNMQEAEPTLRRLEETPLPDALGPLLPPAAAPAVTTEMGCPGASSSELVTVEITVSVAPAPPRSIAEAQEAAVKDEYEEAEMDEPVWHRPLDRRAYRAYLQRQRAAFKACQAAKQAAKLAKTTELYV